MKVNISKQLNDIYIKQHKNYDYAVNSILDNFDSESYVEAFEIIKTFGLVGDKCEINIGDRLAERIIEELEIEKLDDSVAELLLWVAVIFPEV